MKTQFYSRSGILLGAFALALLAGCTTKPPVGVKQVSPAAAYRQVDANALTGTPSDSTVVVLHRFLLTKEFKSNPRRALASLHERACKDNNQEILFALAELNYLTGQKLSANTVTSSPRCGTNGPCSDDARPYYLASTVYAYLYLMGSGEAPIDPFDRRFHVVCDLYNRALGRALATGDGIALNLSTGVRPLPDGSLPVQFDSSHFRWPVAWIDKFLSADHFTVRGLSERYRNSGLGAPLILVPNARLVRANLPKYMAASAGRLKAPATAFLRLHGNLCDVGTEKFYGSLELYSLSDDPQTEVNGRKIPLEIDFTAALASSLQQSLVWKVDYKQLLSGQQRIPTGAYLLQPYQPGKIPVVFVHGTASNPAYWAEMFNTLLADPAIRERYQFIFFIYNTGNPVLYSASLLRDSIANLAKEVDPEFKDASLRQMIVIGHSQGGLLTKLIASSSGDRFWRVVSDKPFEEVNLPKDQRQLLHDALFFEPSPYVKRLVFVATPHRGSYKVGSLVDRLARLLIALPQSVSSIGRNLLPGAKQSVLPQLRKGMPTSIANMRPSSPFVKAYGDIKLAPAVKAHSIIAVRGSGPPEKGNDGVVAYTSAHIEGVKSEFVVRSPHSCQQNPQTIEEIRRILHEHTDSLSTREKTTAER